MPSVTYNYSPGQHVFVITGGTVKPGVVTLVDTETEESETRITYWILVDGDTIATPFDEINVFESCRAAPGYQDVVFTMNLEGSPSPVALDMNSPVVNESPTIAYGSPLGVDMIMTVTVDGMFVIPIVLTVVVNTTFKDIVDDLNSLLSPYATASLFQNNIRITSATTGENSSILITDGALLTGSP